MNLETFTNQELLRVFDLLVRVDHYDPVETPEEAVRFLKAGITHDVLRGEILGRMHDSSSD